MHESYRKPLLIRCAKSFGDNSTLAVKSTTVRNDHMGNALGLGSMVVQPFIDGSVHDRAKCTCHRLSSTASSPTSSLWNR